MVVLKRRLGLIAFLTLFVFLVAVPCSAQRRMVVGQDDSVPATDELKAAAVDSVSWALNKTYVFEDVAKEMEKHLRRKIKRGEYDELNTMQDFARQLTEDIREVSHDRHLGVQFMSDELLAEYQQGDEDPDAAHAREFERSRRYNFQFKKLEIMDGNVGYMKLNGFNDTSLSGPTAVAAMNFLGYTDALIIDLRDNGGGSPSLIQTLMAYLLDGSTHLNSFYVRDGDSLQQFWSAPYVPGPQMVDVGAINPISGTNWEGTGVQPDIEGPADLALDTAYLDALTKLREGAENEEVEFLFDWAIDGLNARLNPVEVDAAVLESYAGDYGPRHLRVENGQLLYNRDDRDAIVATPMTETLFSFDAVPYFRLEVVLGDDGVPVKLIGHYENGRTDENPRDQ
jgi:hypothetical protein